MVNENKKQGRVDDVNRILIGFGGVGCSIVNKLKKILKDNIPQSVDFIVIDSNDGVLNQCNEIPQERRIYLQVPPAELIEREVGQWIDSRWWPKPGGGMGMQRISGKIMTALRSAGIDAVIREVCEDLKKKTTKEGYMITIVTTLGGGTGSGMFIDFALNTREYIKQTFRVDATIFGIGILPAKSESLQKANAMAALKELHFLLSQRRQKGDKDYTNPFTLFFLTGRESLGTERDEELQSSLLHFIMDISFVPPDKGQINVAGKEDWADLNDFTAYATKGGNDSFATFGYYRVVFPAEKLVWYYHSEVELKQRKIEYSNNLSELEKGKNNIEEYEKTIEKLIKGISGLETKIKDLKSSPIGILNKKTISSAEENLDSSNRLLREIRENLDKKTAEVNVIESNIKQLKEKIDDLETERQRICEELIKPTNTIHIYHIPVSSEDIKNLRDYDFKGHCFKDTMEFLDRKEGTQSHMNNYYNRTHDVVANFKILFAPLLNYNHAFETRSMFNEQELKYLFDYGFAKRDDKGIVTMPQDKLGYLICLISTNPRNINTGQLQPRQLIQASDKYIANNTEIKNLSHVEVDGGLGSYQLNYEFNIYSLMIRILPSAVAPGKPYRLSDIEFLEEAYNRVNNDEDRIQHHSFLFGDYNMFTSLTGIYTNPINTGQANMSIINFWKNYEMMSDIEKWNQIAPTFAGVLSKIDFIVGEFEEKQRVTKMLDVPKSSEFMTSDLLTLSSQFNRFNSNISELNNIILNCTTNLKHDSKNVESIITQIKTVQTLPRSDVQENILKIVNVSLQTIERLQSITANFAAGMPKIQEDIENAIILIKSVSSEDKTRIVISNIESAEFAVSNARDKRREISDNFVSFESNLNDLRKNITDLQYEITDKIAKFSVGPQKKQGPGKTSISGDEGSNKPPEHTTSRGVIKEDLI